MTGKNKYAHGTSLGGVAAVAHELQELAVGAQELGGLECAHVEGAAAVLIVPSGSPWDATVIGVPLLPTANPQHASLDGMHIIQYCACVLNACTPRWLLRISCVINDQLHASFSTQAQH